MSISIQGHTVSEQENGNATDSCEPGYVLKIMRDGSVIRRSVFEEATDPATAGEKEFAVYECLRRSAIARGQQHGTSLLAKHSK